MKLRHKIIWFAVMPLVLALTSIAFTVYYRADLLEQQQRESVERAYRDNKDIELKNYSVLAEQSVAHLHSSGRTDIATMDEAITILRSLSYGPNGYFFLFDLQGTFLMHPRQPELVGQNLWNMRDANGDPSIQRLISRALEGGGLVDYMWQKPTNHPNTDPVSKRAYVFVLKNWDLVLGTGVYLDDINATLAKLDKQASRNIFDTMLWIILISSLSVIAIVTGLMWNIRGRSVADAQLSVLTQRIINTQENERTRIYKALHDSVKQMLLATKMKIEVSIHYLNELSLSSVTSPISFKLKQAIEMVDDTFLEIDRITYDVRSLNLELLGLEGALRLCAHHLDSDAMHVEFSVFGEAKGLNKSTEDALFLVAKQAITNAIQYSSAKRVFMRLEYDLHCVILTIQDNGHGFNISHINNDPNRGLGLRNMKERIEGERGDFCLSSSLTGTTIIVTIPFN